MSTQGSLLSLPHLIARDYMTHGDVIKWKHFRVVKGIHGSTVVSPYKCQWRGALMYSLMCATTNCWANSQHAGALRHHLDSIAQLLILSELLYGSVTWHRWLLIMIWYYAIIKIELFVVRNCQHTIQPNVDIYLWSRNSERVYVLCNRLMVGVVIYVHWKWARARHNW